MGKNDRTIYTPSMSGAYYVVVSSATIATGTDTLSVILLGANGASEADTGFPADNTTSGRVEVGASATGNMDRSSDFDWFGVDLEAGKTYQFDLEGSPTSRGSLGDPFLQIFDASGSNKLAEDDDSGGTDPNAQIVYTATATGAHYLTAQTLTTSTGTYTLSVHDITTPPDDSGDPPEADFREGDTDLPANTDTTGVVEVDGFGARGAIHEPIGTSIDIGTPNVPEISTTYVFDTDWFAVELEAGRTYRIDMKGQILSSPGLDIPGEPVDPELTLSLPQINAIYDADGDYLFNTWSRDESSAHHLFRVTFHARAGGTYYIAASGESFEWGGYELRVIDITEDPD